MQILPFEPRKSNHYYKIEQIFSDLKTHAILVQIRNNWCNPQADRSSTEEKQQIFSIINNNIKQILPNFNEKSQNHNNAIDCTQTFKAYFETVLNYKINIMRVFRHKKLCIPILVRFSEKVSTSNVIRTGFEIKK